ncbi:uncharacterized protein LOC130753963 isoform X3 [Actinidia eriantha]|uniref:uncharacterized protein LOC130753963 isoform X3 n=1 Tax=Actinidia eriantha TaxID=165200 RepID=UPI002589358B|nr:uncharacterized protein LOC130753963 isoform X3 [Actinidia eriantha]
MASSTALPIPSLRQSSFSNHHSATVFKRLKSRKIFIWKVSPRKVSSRKEVIMVDPLEAKRLAVKQMEEIKAKEKLKVHDLEKESRNEVKFVRYKRNLIRRFQDACALKKRSMNYVILHLSSYVFLKFHETTVWGRF